MQTAMSQLIDFLDREGYKATGVFDEANNLLQKEKEQIIGAVNDTINVMVGAGFNNINASAKTNLGDIYYNEKFINNEQSF